MNHLKSSEWRKRWCCCWIIFDTSQLQLQRTLSEYAIDPDANQPNASTIPEQANTSENIVSSQQLEHAGNVENVNDSPVAEDSIRRIADELVMSRTSHEQILASHNQTFAPNQLSNANASVNFVQSSTISNSSRSSNKLAADCRLNPNNARELVFRRSYRNKNKTLAGKRITTHEP